MVWSSHVNGDLANPLGMSHGSAGDSHLVCVPSERDDIAGTPMAMGVGASLAPRCQAVATEVNWTCVDLEVGRCLILQAGDNRPWLAHASRLKLRTPVAVLRLPERRIAAGRGPTLWAGPNSLTGRTGKWGSRRGDG